MSGHLNYAYLAGSFGATLIWLAFWVHADADRRRLIMRVSAVAALWGLAQPVFVPVYWSPPSLFNLNHRIGFDIESVVFQFATGGVAAAVYAALGTMRQRNLGRQHCVRRIHRFALSVAPLVFVALVATTDVNPIYIAIIALLAGAAATSLYQPDLVRKMIGSGIVFLGIYFTFFLAFNAVFPGYIFKVWNLHAVSGVVLAGVPLEELLFAFAYGLMFSSLAEHFTRVSLDRDRLNDVEASGADRRWHRAYETTG
ncbi:lycopene cyclase domain-containing protein [Mycobacterium sp. MMS18-G62]